jgi:sulfur relay (sulfurtransferase) complex TusBCD TusD component (DsrE family)
MLTVGTSGPNDPNQATLPFIALKGSIGAANQGDYPEERPEIFLMQEAVCLADQSVDLSEVKAVGLPLLSEVVSFLDNQGLRMIACVPCAEARGIESKDLRDNAVMGEGSDLAKLTQEHDQVLTF